MTLLFSLKPMKHLKPIGYLLYRIKCAAIHSDIVYLCVDLLLYRINKRSPLWGDNAAGAWNIVKMVQYNLIGPICPDRTQNNIWIKFADTPQAIGNTCIFTNRVSFSGQFSYIVPIQLVRKRTGFPRDADRVRSYDHNDMRDIERTQAGLYPGWLLSGNTASGD